MTGKKVGLARKVLSITLSLMLIAGVAIVIGACGGGGGGSDTPPAEGDTGDGGSDNGGGSGSTTLPSGVTITEFTGDSSEYCMDACLSNMDAISTCMTGCAQDDLDCTMQCYADAGCFQSTFTITMTLNNTTTGALSHEIAAGTLFAPDSGEAQTMMILQTEEISIGAGESIHCLPVYCTNSELAAPSAEYNYTYGSVTTNSCLEEVVRRCVGKQLNSDAIIRIQDIIWKCTDPGGSVTQADWDYIDALPAAS